MCYVRLGSVHCSCIKLIRLKTNVFDENDVVIDDANDTAAAADDDSVLCIKIISIMVVKVT